MGHIPISTRSARFSHHGRKSSRHPPPPNRTSTDMCQEGERGEIFGEGDQPSSFASSSTSPDFVFHFEQAHPFHMNHRSFPVHCIRRMFSKRQFHPIHHTRWCSPNHCLHPIRSSHSFVWLPSFFARNLRLNPRSS